ncbi:hypothetical protein [Pseudomonas sp. NPDC089401]|uniref:hypothetical protein n=1 Tax=Pseudomonas sp. NPDC089401 TaxID=3364462 RepID=UPI003803BE03
MSIHPLSHAHEVLRAAKAVGVEAYLLQEYIAAQYIAAVLARYKPWKAAGHLSIGESSRTMPTDENEFGFSRSFRGKPGYLFFEQDSRNKNTVVVISDARELSRIMEECYGMEYFFSDEEGVFLVAVNWYVIEFTEDAFVN